MELARFKWVATGLVVGGSYGALVGWTAWRAGRDAAEPIRSLLPVGGMAIASAFAAFTLVSLREARRNPGGGDAKASERSRKRCRGVTSMLVGPFAAVMLLSGLYATFRFEHFRGLAAATPLLLLSFAGFAAYASCAWRHRLGQG